MSNPNPIAIEIRRLREEAGLSIAALARKAGLSAAAVGSYERGDRRIPAHRADQILAVLDAQIGVVPLGMDMEAVLGELVKLREFRRQVLAGYAQQQAA